MTIQQESSNDIQYSPTTEKKIKPTKINKYNYTNMFTPLQ